MRPCSLDIETRWIANLPTVGAHAYFEDPTTDVFCLAYHVVGMNELPGLWRPGDPVPYTIRAHVANGGMFAGWNVIGFDRIAYDTRLVPLFGFPPVDGDRWLDSMHLAAMANLPRSLDGCAAAVGVLYKGDLKDNAKLLRITNKLRTPVVSDADRAWLENRCRQDVEMEEATLARLPLWPDVKPWIAMPAIDRRINDRGVLIDIALVSGMARAAGQETARLNDEMAAITRGVVDSTTKIEPLKAWLVSQGVALPPGKGAMPAKTEDEGDADIEGDDIETEAERRGSPWKLRKTDIADILARDGVPPDCRMALAFRSEASKASVRKLRAMLSYANARGELCGLFKLGGAQQTMRWSSGGPQLHNLVRNVFANPDEIAEVNGLDVKKNRAQVTYLQRLSLSTAIEMGRTGDANLIRMLYEMNVKDAQGRVSLAGALTWISRMLRRTIAARHGRVLLNGDFSAAQARITAWLSQQVSVLEAYHRGEDMYRFTAAGMYKIPMENVTKLQRQAGKVSILAGGFGGGPRSLLAMAYNYGMLLSLVESSDITGAWRNANQETVKYWYATDDAAAAAVQNPGHEYPVAPCGLVS